MRLNRPETPVLDVLLIEVRMSTRFAQLHHQVRQVGVLLDQMGAFSELVALLDVSDQLLDEIRVRTAKKQVNG